MTVRNAVAVREQAAAEVAERPPLAVLASQAIERQAVTLAKILPQHMTLERFEQVTLAAIKASPGLLRCFETTEGQVSVLYSVIQIAAAGLELGGLSPEAWLIPHERSVRIDGAWRKRWEARPQLSDRGVRTLAAQDPRVRELVADVVRDGDHFVHRRTLDGDVFEHEVRGPSSRPLTHAYCLIRWVAGGALPIVLDAAAVEEIRDRYSEGWKAEQDKAEDKRSGPWSTQPAAMWKKTAIHQARRELRLSPEASGLLTSATSPDDAPDEPPAWPAVEIEPVAVLATGGVIDADRAPRLNDNDPPFDTWPPANEDGEPIDAEVVEEEENPPLAALAELYAAGQRAGLWEATTGLGTVRKRLLAAAAEHCGATYATPEELAGDQDAVELLLAKLTPAAE